jgi:flagellar hook-length control protein FliK
MQDGEISIKHSKDDRFYCDIDLKLKDYGELNLRLTLYDKNQLNIYIKSDSDEFKQIIKEAIPELRRALVDVQITPRDIRVLSKSKEIDSKSVYDEIARDLDIGFEVRG